MPPKRAADARRLTAMSDWGGIPQSVQDKVFARMQAHGSAAPAASATAAPPAPRDGMWILEHATQDIHEHYDIGPQIGQPGQFGRAHRVTHKKTGELRAVKIVSKKKFARTADKKVHFKELRLEIDILRRLSHPNVIRLYDVFETSDDIMLVTEICTGGELFDRIKQQPNGSYTEKDAQQVLRQICTGLAFLHQSKVVHADLKPDNFLFVNPSKDSPLRIIDFGMSKFVKRRQYFHSLRGTPYYIAPEVIKGQYNEACDMWSFGVVMFVMIFGYPPFHADSDQEIFRLILDGFSPVVKKGYRAHFPAAIPCSDSAKDLLARLLTSDTAKRLTAEEALAHDWLTGQGASSAPMVEHVLTNLKNFSAHSRLKERILHLMVNALSEAELQKLKKLFTEIDADGNGHITVAELTAAVERNRHLLGGNSDFTPDELQRILHAADIDGDGTLSYPELVLTSVQRRISAKEERLWIAFSKIDLNRDGLIQAEELSSVLGEDLAEAAAMIRSADKNNDGLIDFDEFLELWAKKEEAELQSEQESIKKQMPDHPDLPPGATKQQQKNMQ